MTTRATDAVIAGVGALPSARESGSTALELATRAAHAAADDAGIAIGAMDGIWACNPVAEPHLMFGTLLAEHMEIQPRVVRTVQEAGAGPLVGLLEALWSIGAGRCTAALVVEADNRGTRARREPPTKPWWVDPLARDGLHAAASFANLAARYMATRQLTAVDLAEVPVAARAWATSDPEAIFRSTITKEDVLASPIINEPLRRLECCPVGDWAGALIVTTASNAPRAVRVTGIAEAHGPLHEWQIDLARPTPLAAAGKLALAAAGLRADSLDVLEVFDAFAFCTPLCLEELGLWKRDEVASRLASGALRPNAHPAVNTHGGMLNHGNAHVRLLVEGIRQVRHEAGPRQVPGVRRVGVVGAGGVFSAVVVAVLEAM